MEPIVGNGSGSPVEQSEIGPDTMIYKGQMVSLSSPIGALTVLHGALQSAIGTVDEALEVEAVYLDAVRKLTPAG
ncbi:MAG: hypothetical protein WC558_00965 [Patulibacter sp.]